MALQLGASSGCQGDFEETRCGVESLALERVEGGVGRAV